MQGTKELTKVFDFKGNNVTVIVDGKGNPWWVAKEVCEILGYKNPSEALRKHVRPHQKNTITIREGIPGNPNKAIINHGGLNRLILRSNLPEVEAFQDWVTDDVLPTIFKAGGYIVDADKLSDTEILGRALDIREAQIKKLESKVIELESFQFEKKKAMCL